ncbi:MAG: hypothetical protein IJ814_06600 [Paludibacteraceae bacterium]|nr:hypothetical protein [Paludibacteraceae bacterium]
MMKRLIGILCCIVIGTGCLFAQTSKANDTPEERIIPIHDLLRYPLGMKDVKWSESAAKQKKKIVAVYGEDCFDKYNKDEINCKIGKCYQSTITVSTFNCKYNWTRYHFSASDWENAYSLAYQILEDLRSYGFELQNLHLNEKGDRYHTIATYYSFPIYGYINDIQYNLISLECFPKSVILRVDTNKKKSKN